jgi:response regulator RpfG family c-di-GMP phosphodiesterase/serine/threonine protein kinase
VLTSSDLLNKLFVQSIILIEDWDALSAERRKALESCSGGPIETVNLLAKEKLLTEYQASRIVVGKTFGLVLGNYRVLERIGAGGMGVVYKAEHIRMRRLAAVKVLALHGEESQDPQLLTRFFTEMRTVAALNHPNIITAIDAGDVRSPNPELPVLHYYVMEYVPGHDLEDHVCARGRLPAAEACDLAYQVASALAEAHKHQLVHRDIKPANVLVTPDQQAKLLDFGLARSFNRRMTEPGTVLGTVDYMAPEQVRDSSTVDIRADIYSLGGTLYYCLSGQTPFPQLDGIEEQLQARLIQPPPSVRRRNPEVDPDLDAVIRRMMALNPDDRYETPEAVMRALMPFLPHDNRGHNSSSSADLLGEAGAGENEPEKVKHDTIKLPAPTRRVLIVDDEIDIHTLCRFALEADKIKCEAAPNGEAGLAALRARHFDVLLLDVDMPGMSGRDVLREVRKNPPSPHLKVVMVSGHATADEMATLLQAGADDYLTKPFSLVQLRSRVKAALQLKEAQDRADALLRHHTNVAGEMERGMAASESALDHARNGLVLVLSRVLERSQTETAGHLLRMRRYVRLLAETVLKDQPDNPVLTPEFIKTVENCVPLHDLGKLALPEQLLFKPTKLTPEERLLVQEHCVLGADMLREAAALHGSSLTFLPVAMEITRSHHEHWEGTGYPDGLVGEAIPLSARLTALADCYDTIRSRQSYKLPLPHNAAVNILTTGSPGQFDPRLLQAFRRCASEWDQVFKETPDVVSG